MLLENWRDFELENQDEESIKKVSNLMPKRVKKRRRIEQDEDAPGSLNPEFSFYELILSDFFANKFINHHGNPFSLMNLGTEKPI